MSKYYRSPVNYKMREENKKNAEKVLRSFKIAN